MILPSNQVHVIEALLTLIQHYIFYLAYVYYTIYIYTMLIIEVTLRFSWVVMLLRSVVYL